MWSVTATGVITYVYTKEDVEREAKLLAVRIIQERKTITVTSK